MCSTPKILKEKEEEWVRLQRQARIPSSKVMEVESRYSLGELRDMARAADISPTGTKNQLCHSLIRAGVIG